MRRKVITVLSIVSAIALVAALNVSAAGKKQKQSKAVALFKGPMPRLQLPAASRSFLRVETHSDLDNEIARLHTAMAGHLSKATAAPAQRVAHFNWINARRDMMFNGWHGIIENVQPDLSGHRVTLRVTPDVTSAHGASTTLFDSLVETYRVSIDGNVTLLGISEPNPKFRGFYVTD